MTDPTGLVLNSLLLPVGPRVAGEDVNLRFAHRAFQDFFLARQLLHARDQLQDASLPAPVTDWMQELQQDS